jgi:glycine hydroxymethyltransferase
LAENAGIDFDPPKHAYPHFYYLDDLSSGVFDISGERVRQFLDYAVTCDISTLMPDEIHCTRLVTPRGEIDGALACIDNGHYRLTVPPEQAGLAAAWLRDLSDGYVALDEYHTVEAVQRKLPGPVLVQESASAPDPLPSPSAIHKPYFIGARPDSANPLPLFVWQDQEVPLRRTPVNELHSVVYVGGR